MGIVINVNPGGGIYSVLGLGISLFPFGMSADCMMFKDDRICCHHIFLVSDCPMTHIVCCRLSPPPVWDFVSSCGSFLEVSCSSDRLWWSGLECHSSCIYRWMRYIPSSLSMLSLSVCVSSPQLGQDSSFLWPPISLWILLVALPLLYALAAWA